jgi:hypothetical protein
MGVIKLEHHEYQPVCNDCGLALCFTLDEREYEREQEYWDYWTCVYCNPHAVGSLARWLESHMTKEEQYYEK